MHPIFRRGLAAAALCLLAPLAIAKPRDAAADLAVMKTLPVYLIVPASPLHGTVPYMMSGNIAEQERAGLRAYGTYGNLIAGSNRSPLGALVTFKWLKARMVNLSAPGMRTLRDAECLADDSAAIAQSIANTIRDVPGFDQAKFIRAESHEAIRDIPRIEVFASRSLTPDFAAVVTSWMVEVYSPDMPKAPHSWKALPTVAYDLAVVSDGIDAPTLETATEVTAAMQEDEENDGSTGKWKLAGAAARRARQWADGNCQRLNEALAANKAEAGRLLTQAILGQLPDDLPYDWDRVGWSRLGRTLATDPAEATQRRLYRDDEHLRSAMMRMRPIIVSRRAGDDIMIDFRYSWIPDDNDAAYDALHADDAATTTN